MSKVTFYISQTSDDRTRLDLFCKIITKAHSQHHHIYVFSENIDELSILDEHLWIFNPNSFIAHDMALDAEQMAQIEAEIVFSNLPPAANFNDILINFNKTVPDFTRQFQRVIEVIDQEPMRLIEGRTRYKSYVETGIETETHKL